MKNAKLNKKCIVLVTVVLFILCLSACGAKTPEEQILGEWNSADREIVWIFYENGNMVGGDGDDFDNGQWYIDETTLSISAVYETVVFNYELDGRTLKLYENGKLTGTLYKVTDEPIDFSYSADMESELVARLEESEIFAQTLSKFDNLTAYVHTGSEGNINENDDVGIYYSIECTTTHKYMTEEDFYSVSFAYSPFADDFYYDGGGYLPDEQDYIWDETGVASEIDVDFFAEYYPEEDIVSCELIQVTTAKARADMTFRVAIDESHNYALEHNIYEVTVRYDANTETYHPDSGRDRIESSFDWTNMYGTWSYANERDALTITIYSIDDVNGYMDISWDFNGIYDRNTYEFNQGWFETIYEDVRSEVSIAFDPDDGISCRLDPGFFVLSHSMSKM